MLHDELFIDGAWEPIPIDEYNAWLDQQAAACGYSLEEYLDSTCPGDGESGDYADDGDYDLRADGFEPEACGRLP